MIHHVTRFAGYLRLSSELQRAGYGLESQEADVRDYVRRNGGVLHEPLFKDIITGTISKRPDLDKLRAMLYTGEIDAVIFPRIDRAGRESIVTQQLCYEILDAGIQLHIANLSQIENTPAGRFLITMFAGAAQLDKEMLVKNLTDGRREKLFGTKPGTVPTIVGNGPRPYGYVIEGSREKTTIDIVPDEADVVRRIFNLLYEGLTPNEVAQILTKERIPSHHDILEGNLYKKKKIGFGEWTPHNVRRIAKDPKYKGKYPGNRNKAVPKPGGKKVYRPRPLNDPAIIWIDIPHIVEPDLWDAVNAQLEGRRLRTRPKIEVEEYQFLMKGRVYCECGYSRSASTDRRRPDLAIYPFYRCNARGHSTVGKCTSTAKEHSARAVDAAVWGWVETTILQTDTLRKALEGVNDRGNDVLSDLQRKREFTKKQMAEAERIWQGRLLAYDNKWIGGEDLAASKYQYDEHMRMYKQTLAETEAAIIQTAPIKVNIDDLVAVTEEVRTRLDKTTIEQRRRLIALYGVEVTLGGDPVSGERVGYITCFLTEEPQQITLVRADRRTRQQLAETLKLTPRQKIDYV